MSGPAVRALRRAILIALFTACPAVLAESERSSQISATELDFFAGRWALPRESVLIERRGLQLFVRELDESRWTRILMHIQAGRYLGLLEFRHGKLKAARFLDQFQPFCITILDNNRFAVRLVGDGADKEALLAAVPELRRAYRWKDPNKMALAAIAKAKTYDQLCSFAPAANILVIEREQVSDPAGLAANPVADGLEPR
jgi:hypothetical protein